jgi:DNA-binding NarL/FixJ family response regulator
MNSVRILIADDHDVVRRGLKALLSTHPGWAVCAEAQTGREAVAKAEELKPDIAILDVTMPELNGLEAARQVLKSCPGTEILMLSMHYHDQLIRDIVESGVRGFIVKSDSDRELVIAVEALANHRPFFTPRATELMLNRLNSKGSPSQPRGEFRDRLTSRERQVVQLLSDGKSTKEVASDLNISIKTAETHRANIMRKLDTHSASELVRYAVRNHLIEA